MNLAGAALLSGMAYLLWQADHAPTRHNPTGGAAARARAANRRQADEAFRELADPTVWNVGQEFASPGEAEAFANRVVSTPWWRKHYPKAVRLVMVRDGRGSPLARVDHGDLARPDGTVVPVARLLLPRRFRSARVVLHELAHIAANAHGETPGAHGPRQEQAEWDLHQQFAPGVLQKA